jgi:hypothetical protein
MPRPLRLCFAASLLLLSWSAPAQAALFAQESGLPVVEYGAGLAATAVVLLVVCWPARRE